MARKQGSLTDNACHLFAELDPTSQSASAIVNFVTKLMIGQGRVVKTWTRGILLSAGSRVCRLVWRRRYLPSTFVYVIDLCRRPGVFHVLVGCYYNISTDPGSDSRIRFSDPICGSCLACSRRFWNVAIVTRYIKLYGNRRWTDDLRLEHALLTMHCNAD